MICLIHKFAHGNITSYQLAKALYLTEYLSFKFCERPVLGLEFTYHHYGPYPKQALEDLEKEGFFKTEIKLSRRGYLTHLKHPCHYPDKAIDDQERQIIFLATKVVKEKSAKGVKELNDFIYSTEPMKVAVKGQIIRMHHVLAKKRIERIKKRIRNKGLSYYITFPEGSEKLENEFLKQTDILFTEDQPV